MPADPRGRPASFALVWIVRRFTVQTILKAAESSVLHREDGLPPVHVRRQTCKVKYVVEDLAGRRVFVQELMIPDAAAAAGISGGVFRSWRISGGEVGGSAPWYARGGRYLPAGRQKGAS